MTSAEASIDAILNITRPDWLRKQKPVMLTGFLNRRDGTITLVGVGNNRLTMSRETWESLG